MKINPVAIQSYQQLNRQDNSSITQAQDKAADQKVVIEPQTSVQKSAVAVKGPSGDYAKYLSEDERQALDLLFSRFREAGRFGAGYQSDTGGADEEQGIGQMVDIKV